MLWMLIIFFSSCLSLFISQYTFLFVKSPGVRYFSLAVFLESLLSFLLMLELVLPGLETKLRIDMVQLVLIACTDISGLLFVWIFTGRKIRKPGSVFLVLMLLPLAVTAFFYHAAFYGAALSEMRLVSSAGFRELYYPYKGYHYLLFVYLGLMLISTLFIYGQHNFRYRDRSSFKHLLVMTGLLFPLIFIGLSFSGYTVGPFRDSSPFFFAVGNLFILGGLLKYRIFDLLPYARNLFFNQADIGIAICNGERVIADSNEMFKSLFLADKEQASSALIHDVLPLEKEIEEVFLGRDTSREIAREITIAGKIFWFNIILKKISVNKENQMEGLLVSVKDITNMVCQNMKMQKKHLELETANKKLSETLENLQNAQHQLISAEKMAALGQLMAGIAHELNTPIGAMKSSGSTLESSINFLLDNYTRFVIGLSEEELVNFQVLIRESRRQNIIPDFKEEHQIKMTLVRALENRGISSPLMLATQIMNHGLYGSLELINFFIEKNKLEEVLMYLGNINSIITGSRIILVGTDKVNKIVSALSTYSHHSNGVAREIDVNSSLDIALTLFYNSFKKGLKINKNFCCDLKINAIENELGQIWINLLQNAVHAVDGRGAIDIATCTRKDMAVVKISDNGKGISPEIKNRIFEPFFTTKPVGMGTGLGLDICRKIAREHQGDITFISEPGHTEFTVCLKGTGMAI